VLEVERHGGLGAASSRARAAERLARKQQHKSSTSRTDQFAAQRAADRAAA